MSVENANELQVLSDLNVKKLQNVAKKRSFICKHEKIQLREKTGGDKMKEDKQNV